MLQYIVNWKKILTLLLLTVPLFLFFYFKLTPNKDTIVSVAGDYPGICFYSNNNFSGKEIDILKKVSAKMKQKFKFELTNFSQIIWKVKNKQAKIGAGGFTFTPERAQNVTFSLPYAKTQAVLLAKNNEPKIAAFQIGCEEHKKQTQKSFPNLELRPYEDLMMMYTELELGKVDAIVLDDIALEQIEKNKKNKFTKIKIPGSKKQNMVFVLDKSIEKEFNEKLEEVLEETENEKI